ncbi:MAG: VanW family protein, partial [Defluviitaleaceae bacterium]|nr:VanW family protein [Defluviitaleaceae bacterium]
FTVTEEIIGLSADIPATAALARAVVAANESGTIEAVFRYVEPSVTAEGLRNAQSLLGTFTTNVAGSLELPRNLNVINAARHINDVVVAPGEVFSTNYYFGAMTMANGYHYAPIIVDGEFVPGIGGGICQVTSTLYMALLFAEMEIVERRNHSLRVTYIDWAMDATNVTGLIDLRWRNNTEHPVYVEAFVSAAGEVVVNIFGYESRSEGRTLRFVPVHLGSTPPSETIIPDPDMPYGQRYVERRGVTGNQYALYKHVYQNNERINRYRVNTSNYRVVNAVVRVGTAGAPDSTDEIPTDVPADTPQDTPPAETGNNQEPVPPATGYTTPPDETTTTVPDPPPADDEIVELPDLSGWLTQPAGPPTN